MSKIDYSKWDKIDYEADEDIVALPPVAPINVTPQAAESAGPFKQRTLPYRSPCLRTGRCADVSFL